MHSSIQNEVNEFLSDVKYNLYAPSVGGGAIPVDAGLGAWA